MATITVTISDDDLPKIVDAVCALHGYSDLLDPPTKEVFAKGFVLSLLKSKVATHERAQKIEAIQAELSSLEDITIE